MNLNSEIKVDPTGLKNALVNFLVPILALGFAVVLVAFVIVPGISNFSSIQAELVETQTLENTLRTKFATLNRLRDSNSTVQEYVDLFERVIPEDPMVPELLTQVDQIARESGLAVTRLSYSITDAEALNEQPLPYSIVVVNLGTLGTYDQVELFLSRLEEAARLVDVVNYRFSTEASAGNNILAGTFILRAPYRSVGGRAVTDVPVTVDISDPSFMRVLERIRGLRFYDLAALVEFTQVEESPVEEVVAEPQDQPQEEQAPTDETQIPPESQEPVTPTATE